jgi:hypothetical protein
LFQTGEFSKDLFAMFSTFDSFLHENSIAYFDRLCGLNNKNLVLLRKSSLG